MHPINDEERQSLRGLIGSLQYASVIRSNSKTLEKADSLIATDCKSLYDLISPTAPPSCQEFRTLLQARLIKEHLATGVTVRWVPSNAQVADCLTKIMDTTSLREVLQRGKYQLNDKNEMLKNRSDQKAHLKWIRSHSPQDTAS